MITDLIHRERLAHLPTPLEFLQRFSAHLGGPRIWMKRDDCTGLAGGGNKTRKLEYLVAAARAEGADTLVTFGALQSNHARQTAAAAAKAGFSCVLILMRRVRWQSTTYESGGNLLLDRVLGADVRIANDPAESREILRALQREAQENGRQLYVIPTGGSSPVGALGYARCAEELDHDFRVNDLNVAAVMHATSSTGTQAGLLAGFSATGSNHKVIGINVSEADGAALEDSICALSNETGALLDAPPVGAASVHVLHEYMGEDYGIPTVEGRAAIELLARTEGILLDPVYSGKGMSGLIDRVRQGTFDADSDVVFIHTGGGPTLSVYDNAFGST